MKMATTYADVLRKIGTALELGPLWTDCEQSTYTVNKDDFVTLLTLESTIAPYYTSARICKEKYEQLVALKFATRMNARAIRIDVEKIKEYLGAN